VTDTVLAPTAVVVGATASDKDEAIDRVGGLLVEHGYVTPDYIGAMRDREAIISTYLGNGIALPHGTSEAQAAILRTGLAVVQYPAGVPWGDEPAKLVIGLAATSDEHIGILSRLAGILGDAELCERLAQSTDPQEIHRVLTSSDGSSEEPPGEAPAAEVARVVRISNPHGLHARPAAEIVAQVRAYDAQVSIQAGDKRADARSITGLLGLGASTGDEITLRANGAQATEALAAVEAIVTSRSE
jgi:phosphotransferase system HPr (HPr) family protein